ncbi:serine/threonine protein kinase, CMGC, dual-specificity [Rhodotorula kratochvilovae]
MADLPRRRADPQPPPARASPSSPRFLSGASLSPRSPALPLPATPDRDRQDSDDADDRRDDHRVSISLAHRVPATTTAAPPVPVRRSLAAGGPAPDSRSPYASPRLPQSVGASPRNPDASSPRTGAPPPHFIAATPPRGSSMRHAASGDAVAEGELATRSPKSSGGSLSRRRPAPLDFSREQISPRSPAIDLISTHVDGGARQALHAEISPRSVVPPPRLPPPQQEDEAHDSLSGLITFDPSSSPVINMAIPSATLSMSDDLGEAFDNDDTIASGTSFLSSSTSGSSALDAPTARPCQPSAVLSSSAYGGVRTHHGLGLGLPFSMSAHAGLSSFAASPTSAALPPTLSPSVNTSVPASPASADVYRSPVAAYRDPNRSSLGFSPVTDRGGLIGLGELATPRWTSGVLEKRWGAPVGEDRRGSADETGVIYAAEPLPVIRAGAAPADSPTVSRPGPVRQPFMREQSFDSPNRPFAQSTSELHPPGPLLPTSSSSATIALDASPAALLNFAQEQPHHNFGPLDFSAAPGSAALAAYAFDAPQQEAPVQAKADVPRRRNSSRRKSTASASAPNSAGAGRSWTLSAAGAEGDVVGLGFDHEIASSGGGEDSRRSSGGSSAAKRSSAGRASVDGKASAKQLRRQSAGKGTFAHLPPSPAASSASHVFLAQPDGAAIPALPLLAAFPSSSNQPPPPPPPLPVSTASTPGRTPDHARLSRHSFHSHHSSPSIIAASILRQTRDLEGVDVEIEHAAAADEGTAAALAKLDGLSSPRIRKTSRNAGETPPAGLRRESSQSSSKRRVRSSTGELGGEAGGGSAPNSRAASRTTSPVRSVQPALPSPSLHAAPAAASPARSPLSASVASMPPTSTSRMASQQNRLASSTASAPVDVPFPSTSPFKRGSSSSATGTSTSATGSHDSTSATSFATRSPASKYRRSSAGSDISSIHSAGDGRPALDRNASNASNEEVVRAAEIPPVPPLPKDWETYRPAPGQQQQPQQSPRFDTEARRPSDVAAAPERYGLQAPPMSATRTTSSSGRSTAGESALPVPTTTAPGGTGRRKWSISSAFHKATRSPKAQHAQPPSGGVKESTSFTDLQSAAGRRLRTASFGQSNLPRRLAASTSNLSTLSDSHDMPPPAAPHASGASAAGSLGRSSIRSGQVPPFLRQRTSSQSSSSTTRTAQWAGQASGGSAAGSAAMPPPSVVTTSPGRSRSSLINPRRTPSGIPFFSRKGSGGDGSVTTPSPNLDTGEPFGTPVAEEKTGSGGRKSILGLNFLRSGGSRRDKEKGLLSPPSATRSTFSVSSAGSGASATAGPSRSIPHAEADEFGRRASLATPKSARSLLRKRGKTLSSADQGDVFRVPEPVQLPPMQMSPLPPSTSRRLDPLSTSGPKISSAPAGSLQTPRTRTSRLQDSIKANLPTIAGSPSTHVLLGGGSTHSSTGPSPSSTPPPKSHTPTRIPRLNRTQTVSPRASPTSRSLAGKPAPRRVGSYSSQLDGASQLSSSVASLASAGENGMNEFGVVGSAHGEKAASTRRRVDSEATSQIPRSRSSTTSRSSSVNRATSETLEAPATGSRIGTVVPRDRRRPTTVEEEKRTPGATPLRVAQPRLTSLSSSTSRLSSQQTSADSSGASTATPATSLAASTRRSLPKPGELSSSTSRRTSAPAETISSSRSARTLSSKMAIPTRVSKSTSGGARHSPSTTDSGRSSAASGTFVADDEVRADAEMAAYVSRQCSKKLAAGLSEDAVRRMFEFPAPSEPLPPLSPDDAISLYSRYLSPYERDEIREYPKVYFVGPNCDKKQATKENTTNNHGFDDERGDYLLVMHDHIQFRYEVIDVLGKGSFGQVLQCRDHKTGDMVAVKIIRNKKRFHHQALVEIKVLENLVKWDPDEKHFVIRMVESFTFRGHLCIVTELLSINLYELVKANSFAGFSTTLIRRFAVQILHSLSLLRHHGVIHCDLKPENILLKHPAKSGIKVIDFGSSCFENEKVYTYIQSRFYRSPEMWSLGCILAEMYTGYPIFPGENEQEQLACVMELMGVPDKYLVDRSSRKRLFFDSTGAPRPVVNSKGRRRRPGSKGLAQVLKCDDDLFVDFIAKCLAWDPERRLKPDQAMRHPFIAGSRAHAAQSSIPSRTSRSSALTSSTSSRHASYTSGAGSSPSISTPMKKTAATSVSTAPTARTRTMSSTTASAIGSTRLSAKASLPAPTRYLKS